MKMVERHLYLNKLKQLKDKDVIKVITGVRRCGKSTLLQQFRDYLISHEIEESQIIAINLEDINNEELLDYKKLHQFILSKIRQDQMNYVFLDEIQNVTQFQKTVDSLYIRENIDLYITGSNAYMLSGELATLLSGRYIEIQMLPLSFKEFYELNEHDKRDAWNLYFKNGGFPYTSYIDDIQICNDYLLGIYNTVLLKDVVARNKINDVDLLERIVRFLFDNIGCIVSSKKIADSLTSYGRKTNSLTVDSYITALKESFILYKVGRYDIKGKQYLKSLGKYYVVDIGLRRMLLGERHKDIGHVLENIVYLELLRRGYSISLGKINELEVDFIAERDGDRIYYQVSASILDMDTFNREMKPFTHIDDHFQKYIITMDEITVNESGVKHINIIDFLLAD